MTAAAPNEKPLHVWLAHHHLRLAAAGIPAQLLSWTIPTWHGFVVAVLAAVLLGGFVVGTGFAALHTGLFCDHCMDRITTDGDGEAARRRRILRHAHRRHQRLELVAIGIAFVSPIPALIPGLHWLALLWAPLMPWLAWTAYVVHVHRRLQPWCPHCHRRRDDDHDPTPAPQPIPEGVAS